jgi:hypothetical protein
VARRAEPLTATESQDPLIFYEAIAVPGEDIRISAVVTAGARIDVKRHKAAKRVDHLQCPSRTLSRAPGAKIRGRMARGCNQATRDTNTNGQLWGLRCSPACMVAYRVALLLLVLRKPLQLRVAQPPPALMNNA